MNLKCKLGLHKWNNYKCSICGRYNVPTLIEMLKNKDQFVRTEAVEALGNAGDTSALPFLVERMNDINTMVCWAAKKAVDKLGGKPRWVKKFNPYNLNDGKWVL